MFPFFNNSIATNVRYYVLIWSVAAILAVTATLGQAAVGKVMGIELAPAVKACQNTGGGGGC